MDLKERFDRALDGGPAHAPIQDRLVAGRRARRRRRTALGATALATVVVFGGIGWAALPGPDDAVDGSVATSPTNTLEPTTASESPNPPPPGSILSYDLGSAELETAPGIVIERRIDSPVERDGVVSTAAEVTRQGKRWWAIAAVLPGRSAWSDNKPAIANRTFEQWVHELVVLNTDQMFSDGEYVPGWVTIGEDGLLARHKGATIVEQTSPARLDQAPEGVPSATATIEVDGARLCVIARILTEGDPHVLYFAESEFQGCGAALSGVDYPGNPESTP